MALATSSYAIHHIFKATKALLGGLTRVLIFLHNLERTLIQTKLASRDEVREF